MALWGRDEDRLRPVHSAGAAHPAARLIRYQQLRLPSTSRVQLGSRSKEWLKAGGNADWLYGYDAWSVALTPDSA